MSCGTLEDSNRLPLRLMISKLIGSDIKAKGLPIRIATNARIAGPRVLIRAIEPTVTSKVAWRKRLAWDEPRADLRLAERAHPRRCHRRFRQRAGVFHRPCNCKFSDRATANQYPVRLIAASRIKCSALTLGSVADRALTLRGAAIVAASTPSRRWLTSP